MTQFYNLRDNPKLYFAGQINGVEGYVESASSGLLAGIYAARGILDMEEVEFGAETAIGALAQYVSNRSITNFQPMNINYGIMKPLEKRIRNKREKAEAYAERSKIFIEEYKSKM